MERRVLAVLAVITSKVPFAVLGNNYFRQYAYLLDPKHKPPHHLEINRIIEVTMDLAVLEVKRIVDETRDRVFEGFASVSTDFWTDSIRRESYGALVLGIICDKYMLSDGRLMFMSRSTAKRHEDILMLVSFLFLYLL